MLRGVLEGLAAEMAAQLLASKQIQDAFDTNVSLVRQQANRFFICKVISIWSRIVSKVGFRVSKDYIILTQTGIGTSTR